MRKDILLMLISLYLFLIGLFIAGIFDWEGLFVLVCLGVVSICILVNIIRALTSLSGMRGQPGKQLIHSRSVLLYKALSAPYFMIILLVFVVVGRELLAEADVFDLLALLILAGIFYIQVLAGSVHAIVVLAALKRDGMISGGQMAVHIIMQLIVILDVIDYMIVHMSVREKLVDTKEISSVNYREYRGTSQDLF